MSDDPQAKLSQWRDQQFSTWLVAAIQIAAMTHPEELRKALASVFDLKLVEDYCKRVMNVACEAQNFADQARELCRQVEKQLEGIEKRLDWIESKLAG